MANQIKWENLFSYGTFVRAISGAVGSVTAMTVFYPLDTARSRLQMEECLESRSLFVLFKDIVKDEGFEALYKGIVPVLQSICCSNFVYFYSFHGLRAMRNAKSQTIYSDLSLAVVAGIINVLTTTPLWVVNTRIKMEGARLKKQSQVDYPHYDGILDGLLKISQNEGVASLWSGTFPSLILVSNPALQFVVYEALRRHAFKRSLHPGAISFFMMGAISKCISTVATYPLQIIQSKLRYGTKEFAGKNLIQIMCLIIKTKGVGGLFKGLEAKLYQTVLTAALMFLCYEKIVAFVFAILKAPPKKI